LYITIVIFSYVIYRMILYLYIVLELVF